MFKKERRFNQPFPGVGPQAFPGGGPQPFPSVGPQQFQGPFGQQAGMYPQLQSDRLIQEILENRRRLNNLARRVSRLENYLRIHETPDGGYFEEESPQNYSF
ncbi:MAG TPA: hypothetical protein GXZ48_05270 [Acholeplasmataceae bacterium]|jgi:hypothetical protein|nr:hypothetical protein [Acholeplasmataceae bacterium]